MKLEFFKTTTGTPANLNAFAADVYGAGAIVGAVNDAINGATVCLVAARNLGGGEFEIGQTVILAVANIDGEPRLRYCGERSDPLGAGSHSVMVSSAIDVATISATLALGLARPGFGVHRLTNIVRK